MATQSHLNEDNAPSAEDLQSITRSKAANTRERILDATAAVLARKGYGGTRLSDVAEVAELQAPAIYYYFDSREDLIEEVMWAGMARLRKYVAEHLAKLPEDTSPLEKILSAVEAHLIFELTLSDYARASIRNTGQLPSNILERKAEEEAQYGQMWRDLFKEAAAANELKPELNPTIARFLVVGALNWAAEWWSPQYGSEVDLIREARMFMKAAISNENV